MWGKTLLCSFNVSFLSFCVSVFILLMLTHPRIGHTKRERERERVLWKWIWMEIDSAGGDRELKRMTSFPYNKKQGSYQKQKQKKVGHGIL